MKKKEKDSKKKLKITLIIVGALLIVVAVFLFWFFNRKFDVTFKINTTEEYTIKVKYNHKIKEEDIKTNEELGENFIAWYEVESTTEENEEVLAEDSYDFETKIKKDTTLRAVYKAVSDTKETITISFNTNGGNKVSSITIEKGGSLTFPANPKKNGYTFAGWTLKNGKSVKNNTTFNEDTTLYASWDKEKENTTTTTTTKAKEETISLSLSRSVLHRNGNKTSKATAKVENASGEVTYSIDNNVCVKIDSKTGDLTAREAATGTSAKVNAWKNTCAVDGNKVIVTATLPSGKSASATLTIEKDLELYASNSSIKRQATVTENGKTFPAYQEKFYVDANQTVTWSAKAVDNSSCTPVNKTSKSTSYEGNLGSQCTDGNYRNTYITATTNANQKLTIQYYRQVN